MKGADAIHLSMALSDVPAIAKAAKVRVVHFENRASGGLDISARAQRLASQLADPADDCCLAHSVWYQTWSRGNFLFSLQKALSSISMLSRRSQQVISSAREHCEGFQRKLTPLFKSVTEGSALAHIRRRMDR